MEEGGKRDVGVRPLKPFGSVLVKLDRAMNYRWILLKCRF